MRVFSESILDELSTEASPTLGRGREETRFLKNLAVDTDPTPIPAKLKENCFERF